MSLTGAAFCRMCSLSLPSPGVPVRTPRRLCACLPETAASPGAPGGGGQPNVTWSLYRVRRGGEEEASGGVEKDGDGGLDETKVKDRDDESDNFDDVRFICTKEASLLTGLT